MLLRPEPEPVGSFRLPSSGSRRHSRRPGEIGSAAKVVQERLGHSSISVTMDIHSSVLPGMQREAVELLVPMMEAGRRSTGCSTSSKTD